MFFKMVIKADDETCGLVAKVKNTLIIKDDNYGSVCVIRNSKLSL